MPSDALTILRQVNDNLRLALKRFRPEQKRCSAIAPGELSGLLAELLRGGECIRNLAAHSAVILPMDRPARDQEAATLEQEMREYRNNLEKLRSFLPDLHARLLAEKARLENAQTHLAAVAAWARASKRTL